MRLKELIEELTYQHGTFEKAIDYNQKLEVEIGNGLLVSVDKADVHDYRSITFKLRRSTG